MRHVETALYLAKVTGRPLAAVRYLGHLMRPSAKGLMPRSGHVGDRAVGWACVVAALVLCVLP